MWVLTLALLWVIVIIACWTSFRLGVNVGEDKAYQKVADYYAFYSTLEE